MGIKSSISAILHGVLRDVTASAGQYNLTALPAL